MRQAISTRYIGPTNFRGSRIKAKADAGTVTISYEYGDVDNHAEAAKALAAKLGWDGVWIGGGNHDNRGNTYVWVGEVNSPSGLALVADDRFDGFVIEAQS